MLCKDLVEKWLSNNGQGICEIAADLPNDGLMELKGAVIGEEKVTSAAHILEANLQIFPPNNNGGGRQGYQTMAGPSEGDGQQFANSWKGVFSISSYTQYFNVDTDVVLNRVTSSLFPSGDFFSKIDANPDLYGLVWISTTLVFVIASLGNCATYLMQKRSVSNSPWSFDVSYINMAAGAVYGYALLVPMVFYFLLQYLGSNVSLVRFWCMWGYSLSVFIFSSILLVIPVEFIRWTIILIAGAASASFVTLNLRSYSQMNDLTVVLVAACVLQYGLAFFIKMWFFA